MRLTLVGATLRLTSNDATMFSVNVVVLTTPPVDVPVIVTITPDTTGAVAAAVKVNVEVEAGLAGVTGLGVNAEAVTPVGKPLILRVTAWEPAPAATSNAETVITVAPPQPPLVPWTRVTLVGATERL
jgi:hypothetical protein